MDIQKRINDWLSRLPNINEYVEWVVYVKQGGQLPAGTTHTLKLASTGGQDIVVALKVKEPYSSMADLLLSFL